MADRLRPRRLADISTYRPGERDFEREVKRRLDYWDNLRQRAAHRNYQFRDTR